MRRFFVKPQDLITGENVVLSGDEFHHLKNVCRLETGERVELLDGAGQVAKAEIVEVGKKTARLLVQELTQVPMAPFPHVKIVLCIPRFQKMDLIIQKCAELGASSIVPVVSERSFVRILSPDLRKKQARWKRISAEASKQSGRAWPLEIQELSTLKDQLALTQPRSGLFLYEGEGGTGLKSALEGLRNSKEIAVFIGAEGGFNPGELEAFEERGFGPATLGGLVLRVETACIAILSVIQYHFDLMR